MKSIPTTVYSGEKGYINVNTFLYKMLSYDYMHSYTYFVHQAVNQTSLTLIGLGGGRMPPPPQVVLNAVSKQLKRLN